MADEIDIASEREEELRQRALAKRKPEGPPHIGCCYNCGAELAAGLRWCDPECQTDWENRMRVQFERENRYYDGE